MSSPKQTPNGARRAADAADVRNVVLVGPSGSGKTTLVEALLAGSGAIPRAGRVEDGNTICDSEDVEKRLQRSVSLAIVGTTHRDTRITLIDTPGHADFVGEVRAGLRAADAALFVVSAADGVDAATRTLWQECAAVRMPRGVVVTHLDSPRADADEAVAGCQRAFGAGVQPLYQTMRGDDGTVNGLLGLLTGTVIDYSGPAPATRAAEPKHLEAVADVRAALIEGIIQESEDDTLLDRYLAGEPVAVDTLIADLETAVARGSFYPVLPVVTTTALGVPEVLDGIVRGFPCPTEHPLPRVTKPDGTARPAIGCDPDGPLVAEVVKTTSDPYVGRVSLVRVFSGTLTPDTLLHVSGHFSRFDDQGGRLGAGHPDHDVEERAGSVSLPGAGAFTQVPRAVAGDIVAVARLSRAETGDTLSATNDPALMAPWEVPEPLLPTAVVARSATDEDKLSQSLGRLVAEDPTLRSVVDPDTHQLVLWTMGDAHLDVLLDRLATRYGVAVDTTELRVALRETLARPGTGHGRHVKQSGGHGQYAVCDIEVEPLPPGSGFEFVDKVVGGAVPRQYISSVEKGIRNQMVRGAAAGYPMVDLRVTLVGGKAHSVDSSDAAFQVAGALALQDAASSAGVTLLEPVDEVVVVVDDEYVGAVLSDLSARRGRVTGTGAADQGRSEVSAEVPQSELVRYAAELRSLAHGTGTFGRRYVRHAAMPKSIQERVLREVA